MTRDGKIRQSAWKVADDEADESANDGLTE
mgnify:CR=1 FL=1